jgi:hypothetical protein
MLHALTCSGAAVPEGRSVTVVESVVPDREVCNLSATNTSNLVIDEPPFKGAAKDTRTVETVGKEREGALGADGLSQILTVAGGVEEEAEAEFRRETINVYCSPSRRPDTTVGEESSTPGVCSVQAVSVERR